VQAGVSVAPGMPGCHMIGNHKLRTSLDSKWGDISLVKATLASFEEIRSRCPHVTHFALASGHDVTVAVIK
jgi:hypothetical protein